jgi:hypothetical protein
VTTLLPVSVLSLAGLVKHTVTVYVPEAGELEVQAGAANAGCITLTNGEKVSTIMIGMTKRKRLNFDMFYSY